jgi:fermentation-respiration switch protein FrsA (DUF1100 family)
VGRGRRKPARVLIAACLAILAVAGLVFGARAMQHAIAFHPGRAALPAAASVLPWAEDVTLTTSDGYALASWFVPPHPDASPRNQAVLLAHGNGGDLSARAPLARELAERGFAVLMLGYRGYAQNEGTPSEAGLRRDALAARHDLVARGFAPEQLIYLGESIGTGVVTGLAVDQPPGGLVLRSPFTSLHDVGATMIPIPPLVRFIMDRNHFPVAEQVANLPATVPVTVIYGTADEVVPAAQSAEVARSARHLAEEVVIEGARHNDGIWFGSVVADAVERLGDAIIPPRASAGSP